MAQGKETLDSLKIKISEAERYGKFDEVIRLQNQYKELEGDGGF